MASTDSEITHKFLSSKYTKTAVWCYAALIDKIPPSDDPVTGVRSKDVIISSEPPVSARIFLPKSADTTRKLPLLFYVHGGGFCMQSAFAPQYHNFLNTFVTEANDWVASHSNGNGPEPWLNDHADFQRVFVAGDSGGGNISHTLLVRVGSIGLPGVKVVGAVLVHPYFGGKHTGLDKMWLYMCPTNSGLQDPRLSPNAGDLAKLGCERVLIFVAENDELMDAGKCYQDELKKSGWEGSVEIVEHSGEQHCFHLFNLKYEKAVDLMKKFVSFVKQD
ncbi:hypothetical protein SLA2020_262860 [Shorea laevis]